MTTCASNFASAKEVSAAITTIGFQASAETLGAISRNCRDEFLDHLSKCGFPRRASVGVGMVPFHACARTPSIPPPTYSQSRIVRCSNRADSAVHIAVSGVVFRP